MSIRMNIWCVLSLLKIFSVESWQFLNENYRPFKYVIQKILWHVRIHAISVLRCLLATSSCYVSCHVIMLRHLGGCLEYSNIKSWISISAKVYRILQVTINRGEAALIGESFLEINGCITGPYPRSNRVLDCNQHRRFCIQRSHSATKSAAALNSIVQQTLSSSPSLENGSGPETLLCNECTRGCRE